MLAPLAVVSPGGADAYKAAGALEGRFRDQVVQERLRSDWLGGERFIYRRELPTGGHELIEVNLSPRHELRLGGDGGS